jgi:large subunit ribosomal protein L17
LRWKAPRDPVTKGRKTMNHKSGINRLGRSSAHRKALLATITKSLFNYERVKTTLAKAKETKKLAEKLITRARTDSVHNRRIASRTLTDTRILNKLFTDIAPRYTERAGGYTRIVKLGKRFGDAAEMVVLELLDKKDRERKRKKKEAQAAAAKEG